MRVIISDCVEPCTSHDIIDVDQPHTALLTLPRWARPEDADHFIAQIPEDLKARVEIFVIRGHRSEASTVLELARDQPESFALTVRTIDRRVDGRPVYLLH